MKKSISSVKLPIMAAAAALLLSITPASAQTIAYDASSQPGNQNFTGNLGMDFDVTNTIRVTALGAFDNNGDGFHGAVTVGIFDRNTQTLVGPTATFTGTVGTLVNGDRFQAVSPFDLSPGNYSVVAIGFNAVDLNGNSGCTAPGVPGPSCVGGVITLSTENGNGAVNFVGSGRFDSNLSLDYPTTTDSGPSNRYLAGTFRFNVAPTFTKAFGASRIVVGQTTTLTFTITNPAGNSALTGLLFVDVLPAGLEVTPGPQPNSCGGGLVATANFIQLTSGSINAGLSTCTITVPVGAVGPVSLATTLTNTTVIGVFSNEAPESGLASDSILVIPADAQLISYAANLGAGQSVIDVTNAGTVDPPVALPDYLCVNVYTFAEDQQLISCCTCNLSPNDLQTLSVQNDLINNTLTPGVPIGVTVALVATDNGSGAGACNAATVTDTKLAAGMRAWGTHLHAAPGGGFALTETPFSKVALSADELNKMTSYCGFIQANGSHFGICNSCKQGAAGGTKK